MKCVYVCVWKAAEGKLIFKPRNEIKQMFALTWRFFVHENFDEIQLKWIGMGGEKKKNLESFR